MVSGGNLDLFLNAISWMCGHEDGISIHSKSMNYEYLTISISSASVMTAVIIWLIPALFFGLLAVEFLGGAMINRFGVKSLWLVWALCIGFQWELQAVQWLWARLGMALVWGSLALLAVGLFAAAHSLLHRSTAQV